MIAQGDRIAMTYNDISVRGAAAAAAGAPRRHVVDVTSFLQLWWLNRCCCAGPTSCSARVNFNKCLAMPFD
jgi:hypothetical protein